MADKNPGDWRNPGKKPTQPAAGAGKREWQKQIAPPKAERKPWSRGSKLALAVALLSAVGVLVFAVINIIRPPKPTAFILLGSSYHDNLTLPHNLYGWAGLEKLKQLGSDPAFTESGKPNVAHGPEELSKFEGWKTEWDKIAKTFNESTIVFSVALHGGADRKGAFLYLNDERGAERLPLDTLLSAMRAKELEKRKVVLLLEPALAEAQWSIGSLHNQFVAQLKAKEPDIAKADNLVVICACDADQRSWASEEWRQTAFSHYVSEGVRGAADADGNGRVTALELFQYAKDRVSKWASANRASVQTPILLGGEERAKSIELTQVSGTHKERTPDEAPGTSFTPPSKLREAWRAYADLDAHTPHPGVYSPQDWRRYQEMLVRYEQAVRFGDAGPKADDLHARLVEREQAMRKQARYEDGVALASRALPMAEALGMPRGLPDDELKTRLGDLWNATKEKRPEILANVLEWALGKEEGNSHLVRAQVHRAYLQFLVESPLVADDDLVAPESEPKSKAQALLEAIEEKVGAPRPAEAHYLTMLLQDVSRAPAPPKTLVRLAVEVRMLAERTALGVAERSLPGERPPHAYAELGAAWMAERVAVADAQRRLGEDWLFGSDAKAFTEATTWLGKAREAYKGIQADLADLRDALAVRDRALGEYSYLARWWAQQRPTTSPEREKESQRRFALLKELGDAVKTLAETLDKEPPVPPVAREAGKFVAERQRELVALVEAESRELAKQTDLQANWHRAEAILSLPLLLRPQGDDVVQTRMKLLEANRGISRTLHLAVADPKRGAEDKVERLAEEQAKRHRLAAVEAFKLFWPKEVAAEIGEPPAKFGETMATLQLQSVDALNQAVDESRKAADPKKALECLRAGEHLIRGLPGGLARKLASDPSLSSAARRLRLHDLFVSQARRTVLDHWHAEAGSPDVTYYRPTAQNYLDAAKSAVEAGADGDDLKKFRSDVAVQMRTSLADVGLEIHNPTPSIHWTSEKDFPLLWTVKAPKDDFLKAGEKDVPSGVAMFWREIDGPGEWNPTTSPKQREPLALLMHKGNAFPLPSYKLAKVAPKDDQAPTIQASLKGLFRGQKRNLASKTDIQPMAADLVVHRFPPPSKAAVSLRLDKGFTYGAVAIALDLSGSMFFNKVGDKTRLEHALAALESALKTVPENTYVSLGVFVTPRGKRVPEIVQVHRPEQWTADQLDKLLRDVRQEAARAEEGVSPIAQLIATQSVKGFPDASTGFKGPQAMLVLTDGDDNQTGFDGEKLKRDWPDPVAEPDLYAKKIRDFLQGEIGGNRLDVHFVCFNQANDPESRRAEKQFKKFVEEGLATPGRFVVQPDPAELARDLEMALRPRVALRQGDVTPRGISPDGEFPTLANVRERDWLPRQGGMNPGQYSAQVKGSAGATGSREREIKLDGGDLLALLLRRDPADPKKVRLDREPLVDLAKNAGARILEAKDVKDRVAAVLENHFDEKANQLHQRVSLEKRRSDELLAQSAPAFVWVETKAKAKTQPTETRWFREYGFPAPAYKTLAQNWPVEGGAEAEALAQMWWTDAPEAPAYAAQVEEVRRKEKNPRRATLVDQFAIFEDVSVENMEVTPREGATPVVKPCLVVRVKHAPGKAVFVQTRAKHRGEEHRYYSGADKCTAIFWDLDDPDQESFGFNVIFLDALKREVESASFSVRGRNRMQIRQVALPD